MTGVQTCALPISSFKGDLVVVGRTEDCEEGIYMHANGFNEKRDAGDTFAFRTGRSRETAFGKDIDEIVELLKHEKEHGNVVWVLGPAFSFDIRARRALSAIISNGYADAVLAGNALATHDLEGAYMNTALGQNIYTQENVHNKRLQEYPKQRSQIHCFQCGLQLSQRFVLLILSWFEMFTL